MDDVSGLSPAIMHVSAVKLVPCAAVWLKQPLHLLAPARSQHVARTHHVSQGIGIGLTAPSHIFALCLYHPGGTVSVPAQALEVLELRDRAAALEEAAVGARARMAVASDEVHRLERAALALEERLAAAQQCALMGLL